MAGQRACQKGGAHACADTLSHFMRAPWVVPVDYVAYCGPLQSPSSLPPRHGAVMALLACLRGLPIDELYLEADRLLARLRLEFAKRWWDALAAIPPGARARIMGKLRLIRALEDDGLYDHANEVYRWVYRRLGLELDVRSLEEVAEAFNAALKEMLGGGQLGEKRLRLFRFAEFGEANHIADTWVLAHNRGQGHLSYTLLPKLWLGDRPVALSLGLTGNVTGNLATVSYRSPAFSAPGARPAHLEEWHGTKSWEMIRECEVRLRTPLPVPGLDLEIYLREPLDSQRQHSLRRMCGARKVTVPSLWPPCL